MVYASEDGDGKGKIIPLKEATGAKWLREKDVEDGSYHRYWVAYPESRLEKKVRHETMYAFQTRKCL